MGHAAQGIRPSRVRLARWRTVGRAPTSGILVGAPHTSSWDWVAMLLLTWQDGVQARVLIKRELFRGPLGVLLRVTGGIPLDRRNPGETVRLCSPRRRWRHVPAGSRRGGDSGQG